MKASPEAQLRLLELADIDAELGRIEHRRRGLPQHGELARLEARDAELRDSISALTAQISDLRREQAKAEADVEQVRSRIDRDRQRLDGGMVSSPRELENLQSEVQSLQRRQSDLEEVVLDVMERFEAGQSGLEEATAEREQLGTELATVATARDEALAEMQEQSSKAGDRRIEVTATLPADLLDLYDKLRTQHGGVGAAALRHRSCQGCNLAINTVDLNTIRAAPDDEVLRCEECRRILVRTADSGL
ncbi:MAG TPA: C4-type zinc ribbon domain-containing protein [Streptosporangiaceae bacterium]|nr:C4-type zinc ribbon domain-containing protein [Streptosporangiaceae bacterium]